MRRDRPGRAQLQSPVLKFDWYPPGPVCAAFVASDALLCGIRGPFGSGKSVACIAKVLRNFSQQKAGPDGVARRRTAIIRNTYPELATTTIKTWHQWIPASVGHWRDKGPPEHHITAPSVDWEVWFIALDRSEDVRKLLSMDLSDAWINEAREVPKAIVDGLTGRVGRYPQTIRGSQGQVLHGCAAPQIIMDTNPPDTDHWWAKMADFPDAEITGRNLEIAAKLLQLGALRPGQELQRFFSQPSGRGPHAENIKNLPPGYYERLIAGKTEDWGRVYVDGEYGFVQEGKPVYPEYRDSVHSKAFELNPGLPVYIGIDFGLTPAAVFCQRTMMGAWRIREEIVTEDMGALRFGEMLARIMREKYKDFQFAGITGDPAGEQRAQTDETTPFQVLKAAGIAARPAPTNDWTKRRETFAFFLNRMVDGEPGLLIHPECQKLRKALAGGYCLRRMQVSGEERFREVPDKNMFSHVAEAAQYALLGAGEARSVLKANPGFTAARRQFADMNYDYFGGHS